MDQNLKNQFVYSIFQFKKMLGIGMGMESDGNKSNLNMSEIILMKEVAGNSIDSENNVGLTEIRGYLSISKAAVSQMLGVLEKKGYINRNIDENNRRNIIVTLTKKGQKVLAEKDKEFNSRLDKIITSLGEDDAKQMIRIINRMTAIVERSNNESDDMESSS